MSQTVGIPSFEGLPLRCGTTTRHFPLKVTQTSALASDPDAFASAQSLLIQPPQGWTVAEQPHRNTVAVVAEGPGGSKTDTITLLKGADGLVTECRDQVLSILTADCLPIFLFLDDPPVAGLVHAGWRGSAKGIAVEGVATFQRRFNASPKKLLAAFGPAIRGCCYEVSEPFRELFPKGLQEHQGHLTMDLADQNRSQLLEAGVLPDRIGAPAPCSACHLEKFYSHRKEGKGAFRMLSWIVLC